RGRLEALARRHVGLAFDRALRDLDAAAAHAVARAAGQPRRRITLRLDTPGAKRRVDRELVRLLDEPYELSVDTTFRTGRVQPKGYPATRLSCRSSYSVRGGRIEISKGAIEREPDVPAGEGFEPAA